MKYDTSKWLELTASDRGCGGHIDVVHFPLCNNQMDDIKCRKRWVSCGSLTRYEDMPAIVEISHNDNILSGEWWIDHKPHRVGNPAIIEFHANGVVATELWYLNGDLHREDGPAVLEYDTEGNVKNEQCFINSKEIEAMDGFSFGTPEWDFQWTMLNAARG